MIRSGLPAARLGASGLPFTRLFLRKARRTESDYEPLYDSEGEAVTDSDGEVVKCLKD